MASQLTSAEDAKHISRDMIENLEFVSARLREIQLIEEPQTRQAEVARINDLLEKATSTFAEALISDTKQETTTRPTFGKKPSEISPYQECYDAANGLRLFGQLILADGRNGKVPFVGAPGYYSYLHNLESCRHIIGDKQLPNSIELGSQYRTYLEIIDRNLKEIASFIAADNAVNSPQERMIAREKFAWDVYLKLRLSLAREVIKTRMLTRSFNKSAVASLRYALPCDLAQRKFDNLAFRLVKSLNRSRSIVMNEDTLEYLKEKMAECEISISEFESVSNQTDGVSNKLRLNALPIDESTPSKTR